MLGFVTQAEEHLDLLLQQEAHRARQGERRPDDAGVGTMAGAEGIIDIGIDALHQLGHEGRVVTFFAGVEAQVLHQLDPRCELGEPGPDRVHRVLRVGLTLGSPEVRRGDHLGAALGEPVDRGQGGADAEVVGDHMRVPDGLHRYVEVRANQHPLAAHVAEVGEGGNAAGHLFFFLYFFDRLETLGTLEPA